MSNDSVVIVNGARTPMGGLLGSLSEVPAPELAADLSERLARLETRIDEAFARAGEGMLRTDDYENFYRLLGCYRGLSEAVISYVRLAGAFDWQQWREMRF